MGLLDRVGLQHVGVAACKDLRWARCRCVCLVRNMCLSASARASCCPLSLAQHIGRLNSPSSLPARAESEARNPPAAMHIVQCMSPCLFACRHLTTFCGAHRYAMDTVDWAVTVAQCQCRKKHEQTEKLRFVAFC